MNKGQLIDAVQSQLGGDTSRAAAEAAVNAVLDSVTTGVKSSNVQIIGFGTFKKTHRKARQGVNPRTKEKIQIKASTTVTFKAGAKLKAAV